MRKGKNIAKNKPLEITPCDHRVIIPLYIPEMKGYYKDSFKVFEMSLQSILKTSSNKLKISVVSNGSCDDANIKLSKLQNEGFIDELIIEKEAIGKINSILKALRTAQERLITITDADVLFLNQWEEQVINVFKSFPKAGMVSPVPIFRTQLRYTSNIWLCYFFSNRLKFRPVKNPEALTRFANSLGWSYLSDKLKDVILTLKAKNNTIAVVGNAHFVGTYKREVFDLLPSNNSAFKLGGSSERLYTDLPVIKSGGYRLATYDNYAYHLGNTIEPWMTEAYDKIETQEKNKVDISVLYLLKPNKLRYFLTETVFSKLFYSKGFKKYSFKLKGLNKTQITNFFDKDYE